VKLPLLVLAAAAGALAVPERPRAANLEISPVLVEIGPRAPSAVVTVRNGGTTPLRYQVSAMGWSEPAAGETKLTPSDELAAYPPLFALAPGEERKLRVGATVPPGTTERAWRLFVEELPSALDPAGQGAQIRIRTRFAIPVFQAPVRSDRVAAVALVLAGGRLRALVRSAGNVHVRPVSLALTLLGATGEKLHAAEVTPTVVLAMAERASDVEVPAGVCAQVRSATLVADLGNEQLRAALPLPGGACAP
jgi:fimbrial chaperone protein